MTRDFPAQIQGALSEVYSLLQDGKRAAGASLLRRVLANMLVAQVSAAVVSQVSSVARAWIVGGQIDQALALLAPVAESNYADSNALMLYAHVLMELGERDGAEVVLRRWLQREPENADASMRLAAVLADTGRAVEAESIARRTLECSGASVIGAYVLGRALLGQSRFDEAEAEFRKAVRLSPTHQTAQTNLMELVWMRTGDVGAATQTIDRALRDHPELTGLRISKAQLLAAAHLGRQALGEIDAGLVVAPADIHLLTSGVSIALSFDAAKAWAYAGRLPSTTIHDRSAQMAKGSAALAMGRAADALAVADALLSMNATDGRATALRADALRMCGDDRYRELLDYTHLVSATYLDVPEGWPSLAAYLDELAKDVSNLHVLEAHPIGNSLRNGSQIELDPVRSPMASVRAFSQAIDGPIQRYISALGRGADPMRRRNTGGYAISGMWSVRLHSHGYHVNHHHPDGWISSACYLSLPAAVKRRGEGWLQFGEPPFPTTPRLDAEYVMRPEPGLLALFPSYMWHGTLPFDGSEADARLTIAFDVVPV